MYGIKAHLDKDYPQLKKLNQASEQMRLLITICFLILSNNCFTQNGEVKGKIINHLDSEVLAGVTIKILETQYSTQSDINGIYSFQNIETGKYDIEVELVNFAKDTIKNIEVKNGKTTELIIKLPVECFSKNNEGICPNGKHRKNVIPIIYGFPNKRQLKKSKNEKIKLGNCTVTGCETNWYCKKHKIKF